MTRSPFGEYLAVYRSDQAAAGREVRGALTGAQYQAAFDAMNAKGFYPICLQAGGDPRSSPTPRFVALFERPATRFRRLPASRFRTGALAPVRKPPLQ